MGCMLSLHYHTTPNNLGTYRLYFVKFKLKILPTKSTQLRRVDDGSVTLAPSTDQVLRCAQKVRYFSLYLIALNRCFWDRALKQVE